MFSRFDRIPACDRRTDRQRSCDSIVRAICMVSRGNEGWHIMGQALIATLEALLDDTINLQATCAQQTSRLAFDMHGACWAACSYINQSSCLTVTCDHEMPVNKRFFPTESVRNDALIAATWLRLLTTAWTNPTLDAVSWLGTYHCLSFAAAFDRDSEYLLQ